MKLPLSHLLFYRMKQIDFDELKHKTQTKKYDQSAKFDQSSKSTKTHKNKKHKNRNIRKQAKHLFAITDIGTSLIFLIS